MYWWLLFPLKYISRNAEKTIEFKMKIKSALRGSEKTAPNILFKKLNIIYKSIFHKQLFFMYIYIYISTWKSYYKGDTSFAHTDPPVKTNFTLSMWPYCHRSWGSTQTQLRTCGHQVWLWFMSNQPISSLRLIWGRGCWVHFRVAKDLWPRVVQRSWNANLPAGLQFKMKAAAGWGIELPAFPFLTSPFPFPSPCSPTQV